MSQRSTKAALTRWRQSHDGEREGDSKRRRTAFLENSIRDSTAACYQTAVRHLETFLDRSFTEAAPTAAEICDFIEAMAESKTVQADTLSKYISAIKTRTEIVHNVVFTADTERMFARFLKAAENVLRDSNRAPQSATPLPVRALAAMKTSPRSQREVTKVAMLLAITLVLRFDQIVRMRHQHIKHDTDGTGVVVTVVFHDTKTRAIETRETSCKKSEDQCQRGGIFCTAHFLRQLAERRPAAALCFPDLCGSTFGQRMRRFMLSEFSGKSQEWDLQLLTPHSLRHTGANILKAAGVTPDEIKKSGGWTSEAWEIYGARAIQKRCQEHAAIILGNARG